MKLPMPSKSQPDEQRIRTREDDNSMGKKNNKAAALANKILPFVSASTNAHIVNNSPMPVPIA